MFVFINQTGDLMAIQINIPIIKKTTRFSPVQIIYTE